MPHGEYQQMKAERLAWLTKMHASETGRRLSAQVQQAEKSRPPAPPTTTPAPTAK